MSPRQYSILIGAVVAGLSATSYLSIVNAICCLGVIVGGVVAVQQYESRSGALIEAGDGAVIGALAGAGGAVLGSLFNVILRPFGLDATSIFQGGIQQLMQSLQGQQGMSPEMMQQMQQGADPGLFLTVVGLLFNIVTYAIFGAVGGALGAAIFGGDGDDAETPEA